MIEDPFAAKIIKEDIRRTTRKEEFKAVLHEYVMLATKEGVNRKTDEMKANRPEW